VQQLSEQMEDEVEAPMFNGVFGESRQLYKRVAEYSYFQSPDIYQKLARKSYDFLIRCAGFLAEQLTHETGHNVEPWQVIIDAPPPRREVEFKVQIYFVKEQRFRPLTEVSPVVESMAQTQFDDSVKRVRVFVHPDIRSLIDQNIKISQCLESAYLLTQGNLFPAS
jgi:hypothetical protein